MFRGQIVLLIKNVIFEKSHALLTIEAAGYAYGSPLHSGFVPENFVKTGALYSATKYIHEKHVHLQLGVNIRSGKVCCGLESKATLQTCRCWSLSHSNTGSLPKEHCIVFLQQHMSLIMVIIGTNV